MKHKTIFILFLFLLVLPLAFSAPPAFQSDSSTTTGIDIKVPSDEFHQVNSPFEFHWHTFNISNGVPLLNNSLECYFHLYNKSGNHILKQSNIKNMEVNGIDWSVNINKENFSYKGTYNYLVQCNGTSGLYLGGFMSSTIIVTELGGEESITDTTSGIAITLFILICAGLFLILPIVMDDFSKNKFVNVIMKRCCFVIGIYLMVLNSSILATISKAAHLGLEKEMFRYTWLFGWIGYLFIAFTVLKTLLDVLKMWKIDQADERMGNKNGKN